MVWLNKLMFLIFYREDPVISSVIMSVKVAVAVLDSPEPAFNPAVFEDNLLIFHQLSFKKAWILYNLLFFWSPTLTDLIYKNVHLKHQFYIKYVTKYLTFD